MNRRRNVAVLGAALLVAAALMLTACGGSADTGGAGATAEAPSATEHNDADVAFATDMIPHHAQALVMVDLTRGRPTDPAFAALSDQILAAQAPEIETMSGWLTSWGEDVPATVRDHVNGDGHDMGDMGDMGDMPGMMSAEDMTGLEQSDDAAFQDRWLEMMIDHHQGAIEMAQVELDQGRYQPALDLAQAIIDSQTAEIKTMQAMLGG